MTDYAGIDYGLGRANVDAKSGIRYGVINQHAVGEAWYEESEPYYGDMECECGCTIRDDFDEDECPSCKVDVSSRFEYAEPSSFYFEDADYSAECGEDGDIFIVKSPYFTYAQFCSPCAPGAVHLENPLDSPAEANRGFCLGPKWFEDEKAPYPVYSVETGELVSGS